MASTPSERSSSRTGSEGSTAEDTGSTGDSGVGVDRTKELLRKLSVASIDELRHRRETRIREALPTWKDLLAHGSVVAAATSSADQTLDPKLRKLWWQGIPPSVRARVWPQALANTLNITPELFDILLKQAAQARSEIIAAGGGDTAASDPSSSDSGRILGRMGTVKLIPFDMPRTFALLQFFRAGGPLHESLREVLEAYVFYRPDLGYVQGMTFLASVLLLSVDTPADAFMMLANMLNMPFQRIFYAMNAAGIDRYAEAVERCLRDCIPKLARHFAAEGIHPQMFFVDWVMTVFSKALPLDIAAHIWDVFVLEGEPFVFRAVLGILHHFRDELLRMQFDGCVRLLTNVPQDIIDEALFESIQAIPLNEKKWAAYLKQSGPPPASPAPKSH